MRREIVAKFFAVAALSSIPSLAWAASDVSNSPSLSNKAISSQASSIASSQTSSIISSAAAGGFTAGAGGFSAGGAGAGGFSPSSGTPGPGAGLTPGNGPGSSQNSMVPFTSTRQMGKAGGSEPAKFGVWTQGTYGRLDNSEAGLQMKGDIYTVVGGADYKVTDQVLTGVAVSYETTDIDTTFNQGKFKGSGVSVAPYVGVTLTPNWSWDLSAGYSWLNYDVKRNSNAVTGSYNGNRLFGSTNVIGGFAAGNWRFQPKVGVLFSREDSDAYQESAGAQVGSSHNNFGRATAGSKIGYETGYGIPYVKVMGEWDFLRPDSVLKSNGQLSNQGAGGGVFGAGYEIYSGPFTASLEGNYNSLFREDLDLWTVALRGRVMF
jgi:hypothetical protein